MGNGNGKWEMGGQGTDGVSRRLDWKTKSSLRLDCRTMAGLYTGGTVPILTKRTMGSVANDIAQWELRIIVKETIGY